jgi:hypothetical protein
MVGQEEDCSTDIPVQTGKMESKMSPVLCSFEIQLGNLLDFSVWRKMICGLSFTVESYKHSVLPKYSIFQVLTMSSLA